MAIKTFREIKAWQIAYQLVLAIYRLTLKFPPHELFGLTAQLRRAAISITFNIAEGYKRNSLADRLHFYNMAETSLEEVKCGLMLVQDLHYITKSEFEEIFVVSEECGKVLHGWIISQQRG